MNEHVIVRALMGLVQAPPVSPAPPTGAAAAYGAASSFLDRQVLGNSLWQWIVAVAVALITVGALRVAKSVALRRLKKFAAASPRPAYALAVELVSEAGHWFFLVLGLYLGTQGLALQPAVDKVIRFIVVTGIALQIGAWANSVVVFSLHRVLQKRGKERGETDGAVETTMVAVRFVSLILVYSLVVVIAADNLGFNVTALITGLGVGGVAVALAVQSILGDLFGALSIVLDKPFVVGDFIIVGEQLGTVEHIGLKSTRVRALSGELLVFRNTDLLASRIQNFKKMQERRVVFTVGVTHRTPVDKVEALAGVIREVIQAQSKARFDRAHFARFMPSSLEFEAVYYVLSAEYNVYMDIQQRINLGLLRHFSELGVELATPVQTLRLAEDARGPRGTVAELASVISAARETGGRGAGGPGTGGAGRGGESPKPGG